MKKFIAAGLAVVTACSLFAGCGSEPGQVEGKGVSLGVTTTFGGEDSNAKNFKDAVKAWEEKTGNTIQDSSATSDETFKSRIVADFETGAEPDVLFYFNGVDSNSFVEAGKVVSIEEIRKEYPEYASNMQDEKMGASPLDGKNYSVPVNGYWETLYVNTNVLKEAGVEVPGKDYTWDAFLEDCEKIKKAGYTPLAAALGHTPHYWFEYSIFNELSPSTHCQLPEKVSDEHGKAWVTAMGEIKSLYEKGYFPENTLSATDDETFAMFMGDKAAFLIDGSWKVGGITNECRVSENDPVDEEKLAKIEMAYVPGKGERKATDLVGGLSMGYYITKKAWDDPEKKEAAVQFVEFMTSDEMVTKFAAHTASALKKMPKVDESKFNSLQIKAMKMMTESTSLTPSVQDLIPKDCRTPLFDGMPQIVTGEVKPEDAVSQCLELIEAGK